MTNDKSKVLDTKTVNARLYNFKFIKGAEITVVFDQSPQGLTALKRLLQLHFEDLFHFVGELPSHRIARQLSFGALADIVPNDKVVFRLYTNFSLQRVCQMKEEVFCAITDLEARMPVPVVAIE